MDPIADMLIKLKNAGMAKHELVLVPVSKMKRAILESLQKEGYISGFSEKAVKNHQMLEVTLAYQENKKPKITEVIRVSKPSRRMYMSVKEIKPVKNGHGIILLSTPKGILSGALCRKEMVGGEVLCKIW